MVAIVSGNNIGLGQILADKTSGTTQSNGFNGSNPADKAIVNITTGNFAIQDKDSFLIDPSLDAGLLRTYNSQGTTDGDNDDNWRIGFYRKLSDLHGELNQVNSSLTRTK